MRRSSTDTERRLWAALRSRQLSGYKFRGQVPIGPIVDFAYTKHLLIVEADGGQHADNPRDASRTAWLENRGWRVLRFWDNDILQNIEGVSELIVAPCASVEPSPSHALGVGPSLSRSAGEGKRADTRSTAK